MSPRELVKLLFFLPTKTDDRVSCFSFTPRFSEVDSTAPTLVTVSTVSDGKAVETAG